MAIAKVYKERDRSLRYLSTLDRIYPGQCVCVVFNPPYIKRMPRIWCHTVFAPHPLCPFVMSVCAWSSGRLIHSVMPSRLYLCFSFRLWQSFHHCVLMQNFFYFFALHTLRKSVLQAPVYHDHQERKRRSASLSSISIPNYIDYTFIPFFSLCRVLWALLFPLDLWATWLTLPICILENQFRSTEWFGLERTRIS